MAKLKRPPKKKMDDFLSDPEIQEEAETKAEVMKPEPAGDLPWEGKSKKVVKGINLRLTEVQHEKLKFAFEHSIEKSLQKYIMSIIEPAVEAKIKEVTGKK